MDRSIRQSLKERQLHGDEGFPFGAYRYDFAPKAHVVDTHWHQECEIFTVLEGEVLFQIGTEYIPLKEGESVFIDGGEIHTGHASGERGCRFCALVFDSGMLASAKYDAVMEHTILPFQDRSATLPRRMTPDENPALTAHIAAMIKLTVTLSVGYETAVKGRLLLMLAEAAEEGMLQNRSRTYTADSERTARLKKVIAHIQASYREPITLAELAGLIPMSEGQFCRFFKSMTGQTPIDYINSYRVRQAAGLLREPEHKISDIAMDVGFGHISYFVRVFRKFMNCTPSQYRKKQ